MFGEQTFAQLKTGLKPVEYLPLLFFRGGHRLQEREGFLPQGI